MLSYWEFDGCLTIIGSLCCILAQQKGLSVGKAKELNACKFILVILFLIIVLLRFRLHVVLCSLSLPCFLSLADVMSRP